MASRLFIQISLGLTRSGSCTGRHAVPTSSRCGSRTSGRYEDALKSLPCEVKMARQLQKLESNLRQVKRATEDPKGFSA